MASPRFHVLRSDFVTTVMDPAMCPPEPMREVAFAGRSNVGKSSLINALVGRRKLVRVSNTPGRTRALNFFRTEVAHDGLTTALRLCDLPGYGFARVSKGEKGEWVKLIEGYLQRREQLGLVVQLVDGEIGPQPLDMELRTWLSAANRPFLPVATKMDRLPKSKRIPALRKWESLLGVPERSLLGISSEDGTGLEELWAELLAVPEPAVPAPAEPAPEPVVE